MSTIMDAVTWSGSKATLSLFAIYPEQPPPDGPDSLVLPEFRLQRYLMDDEAGGAGGSVVEYDFHFDSLPSNLRDCLAALLAWARSSSAVVAWFGFEGSFHFEHLLTADIASQVYALADVEGVAIAEDEDLPSISWQARVVRAGRRGHAIRRG